MSSLNLILYKNVLIIFLITKTINEISLKSTVHCLTINNISKIYTNNNNNNNSNSNNTNNENNNISNNNKNLNHDLNHNKNIISSSKQIDDREKLHSNVDQDQTKGSLSKEIVDQLTTNNPCLVHYCSKGRECILDNVSGQPTCICQRYCSHRKRPICGSDGKIYENHCELHRSSCLYDRQITYQRFDKCSKPKQSKKPGLNAPKNDRSLTEGTSSVRGDDSLKEYHDFTGTAVIVVTESTNNFQMAVAEELVGNIDYKAITTATQSTVAIANGGGLGPPMPAAITLHDNDMDDAHEILAQATSNRSADIDSMLNDHILPTPDSLPQATTYPPSGQIVRPNFAISGQSNETGQHPIDLLSNGASVNDIISSFNQNDYCSSQEYEIMKDNLLLYSHARLMSQDNKHSKDFLVSIMFSHYDQNNNGHLEIDELNQISINEHLNELSNGCILDDMINFDDTDHDGKLSINEFYQAFSKLYSVSVVSLDKALETNHLSARVGDNVEIKCDVTGTPLPPIIWVRNNVDLSLINENDVRVFNDGSLYLTRIQLQHSGNYTCHAQRNKDVVQTHMLSVYTIPEVRVMPRIQSKRPGENAEMFCHVTGDPFPKVEWLKNDDRINLNIPDKYNIIGNGTALKIHNIAYSDTGAYMCQATNIGGSVRDISSLIVQEEPTPTVINEEHKFFVFYEYGVAVYEPSACRLHHQIQGTDIIPGTQEYVCGEKGVPCSWGNALNVGTRYIYVSQPIRDRVLVISTIQMVVVDVISTDKYPVELFYVPRYDQVWILNWRYSNNIDAKTIQVIRDAGQKRKHHTVHPEPIDGQFDLVKSMFIPSADIEQPHYSYKYGYVTHKNQRGLYKLDLANLRYTKSVDLTLYNCVPEHIKFSALYGFVIISCREPITNRPHGQIVLDYLTDAVLTTKLNLNGIPRISPDSRHLATIEHNSNGVKIVIQKIAQNGLEFLFDVKTTLNISDITFFESQTMHGYDLFATASDKEDILYLNLYTGKVEMITGVGPAMSNSLIKWGNPTRLIRSSGLFGQYMVTPASNALFIINGKARTVNCEIGGVLHPIAIVWTHNINSYMTNSFTESSILRP